jgi:hypothetical protein
MADKAQRSKTVEGPKPDELSTWGWQLPASLEELLGNAGVLDQLGLGEVEVTAEAPVADSAVEAVVVQPFNDGGGFLWTVCPDGCFECVGAPASSPQAIGVRLSASSHPEAHARLAAIVASEVAEVAPPGSEVQVPAEVVSPGGVLADEPGFQWVYGAVQDTWESVTDWWWAEDPDGPTQEPIDVQAPEEQSPSPKQVAHDDALADGKTNVVTEAIALAETSDKGHGDEVARPQTSQQVWAELNSGEIDSLGSVKCSEFTSAAMAAAGYDLDTVWLDPATGLRVAYADGSKPTFVAVWMISGALKEATYSLLVCRDDGAEEVVAGSDRAAELNMASETDNFLYVSAGTFVGREADSDDMVGAGAAVVAFGGRIVDSAERRPGDVQQRFNTNNAGKYVGTGHSSVVHSIRGSGVAKLGDASSPSIEGSVQSPSDVESLQPGWYRISPGSGLQWVVTPETSVANVAEFTTEQTQLIDANIAGSLDSTGSARGGDATQLGAFHDDQAQAVTCSGRLPSSPWFAWESSEPAVSAELSATASPTTSPTESL